MEESLRYPFKRNRYFYGKLLTVRDFETEQRYFNDKRRLLNRLMFGTGIVCGLNVVNVDGKTITVSPGLAIDHWGREIIVPSMETKKLYEIDNFPQDESAKELYLCIEYLKEEVEVVSAVASSSEGSEEKNEHNYIKENYRLFFKENPPESSTYEMQMKEKTMESYTNLSLDELIKTSSEQCICLAKISVFQSKSKAQAKPVFMIENVERAPFGDFVYNMSMLYRLGLLDKSFPTPEPPQSVPVIEKPEEKKLDVFDREECNRIFNTGIVDIPFRPHAKAGKSYFSEEIEHGLGQGAVAIITGIEEVNKIDSAEDSEQIFYGDYEIFKRSPSYEALIPEVSVGTVVYPKKGTFRIGVNLERVTRHTQVQIRWWAYKENGDV